MRMWQKIFLGTALVSFSFLGIVLPSGADPTAKPVLSVGAKHASPLQGKDAHRLPSTLPPSLFLGRAAEAYRAAAEIPEVLVGLACYCGCDKSVGHRYLLDCFADDHGAG